LALGQHFASRDSWICSPPGFSISCAATRARSSLIGSTAYWTCWRACPKPVTRSPRRLVPGEGNAADQECLFSENLGKYIETTRSAAAEEEEESKRRGLLMLNQAGER